MNNIPMTGPEALILVAAATIAWIEVAYGPKLRSALAARRVIRRQNRLVRKTPKSWDRRNSWS